MTILKHKNNNKFFGASAKFNLVTQFKPSGDQINAISELSAGVINGKKNQVLLGVTGSGKTFTMANVILKSHLL